MCKLLTAVFLYTCLGPCVGSDIVHSRLKFNLITKKKFALPFITNFYITFDLTLTEQIQFY